MANEPKMKLALVSEMPENPVRGTVYMSPDTSGNFVKVGVDGSVRTIFDGSVYVLQEQLDALIITPISDEEYDSSIFGRASTPLTPEILQNMHIYTDQFDMEEIDDEEDPPVVKMDEYIAYENVNDFQELIDKIYSVYVEGEGTMNRMRVHDFTYVDEIVLSDTAYFLFYSPIDTVYAVMSQEITLEDLTEKSLYYDINSMWCPFEYHAYGSIDNLGHYHNSEYTAYRHKLICIKNN